MEKTDFNKPYIIAETAYNHEGDFDYIIKMINEIADLKLDAVKYHLLLNINSYITIDHPLSDKVQDWLFTENQWDEILNYSKAKNLDIIALCDDVESVKFIKKKHGNIYAVEVHSTSINDFFLLKEVATFKGKIILGIGGTSLDEIQYAINFLNKNGKNDIILMYGFQSYPTDYNDINLKKIIKIRNLFNVPIGYADHTDYNDPNNEIISILALMMGINIIEKHFTLNPGEKRIDNKAAVSKKQMIKIKELMDLVYTIRGNGAIEMSDDEKAYGNTGPMKKAIVARCPIMKGEKIKLDKIWFKRTDRESPVKQSQLPLLLGLKVIKDIKTDEIIDFNKVEYNFKKYDSRTVGLNQKKGE